jgi:hypothetical protein
VGKHRRLQPLQLRAGVKAQLLAEQPAGPPVDLQRLGLPARLVQGAHELPAEPLAQRVLGDQRLQLPDDRGVAAKGQVGLDPVLHRRQPQLGQPCDLPFGEGLVRHVGKGRAPPQRQPLGQQRRRGVGAAGRQGGMAFGGEPLEPDRVDLLGVDREQVAGGVRPQERQLAAGIEGPA